MECLFTLTRVLEGPQDFVQPVLHVCCGLGEDCLPRGILCGVLQEYGVDVPLLRAIQSLYRRCESLVHVARSKSDLFLLRVAHRRLVIEENMDGVNKSLFSSSIQVFTSCFLTMKISVKSV